MSGSSAFAPAARSLSILPKLLGLCPITYTGLAADPLSGVTAGLASGTHWSRNFGSYRRGFAILRPGAQCGVVAQGSWAVSPQQMPKFSPKGQAARHAPQRSDKPGMHSAGQFDAFHHSSTTQIRWPSPPQQPKTGVSPSPHQHCADADPVATSPQPSVSRTARTARAKPPRCSFISIWFNIVHLLDGPSLNPETGVALVT